MNNFISSLLIGTLLFVSLSGLATGPEETNVLGHKQSANCQELASYAQTILDSSFFFKDDCVERTNFLAQDVKNSDCEFYPLLLTILGFQKFVSNDIIDSRLVLLKADSIYAQSINTKQQYYIRNKIFLGLNYNIADDTIKSLRYLNEAVLLAKQSENNKLLADALHNIGVVYLNSNSVALAEDYINKAIVIARASQNYEILGFASLNYSRIQRTRNELNEALLSIEEAKKIFTQLNDLRNLYLVEVFKSEVHMELGEYEKSIPLFKHALNIGDKSDHKYLHAHIYMNLGRIYLDSNEHEAMSYNEKALDYASFLNKKEIRSITKSLSKYYLKTGNLKKQNSLVNNLTEFYNLVEEERRMELIDSNNREIEYQKEVTENKILQLKNESNKRMLKLIAFGSILCFLFGIYALFQLLRNKKLTKKVNLQNSELQNKNIELKNFASIASHDLKAPVRSIASFSALIEKLLPKGSNPKLFEYLAVIKDSSFNMNALVDSLLQFSTIENRKLELSEVSLNELIKDVVNNLYSLIESKSAKIHIADNLPQHITGDETLLRIVFQNIINNALKFVSEETAPIVEIGYDYDEANHFLTITDNGIGIAKEHLEKIFLIFERLHSSKEYNGSGIGLATCKKIMLLHEGEISIESEVGTGSKFILSLPKAL